MLHNQAHELQLLRVEQHEQEITHEEMLYTMQRQMSLLTVEKMKMAQRVGVLEAENADLRQKWIDFHAQFANHATESPRNSPRNSRSAKRAGQSSPRHNTLASKASTNY